MYLQANEEAERKLAEGLLEVITAVLDQTDDREAQEQALMVSADISLLHFLFKLVFCVAKLGKKTDVFLSSSTRC